MAALNNSIYPIEHTLSLKVDEIAKLFNVNLQNWKKKAHMYSGQTISS